MSSLHTSLKEALRPDPRGRTLTTRTLSWLAWFLCLLCVALAMATIVFLTLDWSSRSAVGSTFPADVGNFAGLMTVAITFATVGALIASQHPKNPIGWLFSAVGLMPGLEGFAEGYAYHTLYAAPGSLPGGAVIAWLVDVLNTPAAFCPFLFVLLLFPNGRLLSPRWRPLIWLIAGMMAAMLFRAAANPGPLQIFPSVTNPFGVTALRSALVLLRVVLAPLFLICSLAAAIAVILRFRRARGDERTQLKWVVSAGALLAAVVASGPLIWTIPTDWPIWPLLIFPALITFPIATGVAILKYHLYDIDIIINRALVYGALTASIVGLYVLIVGYFGVLFQTGSSLFISLIATGLVAVLFQPLRDRLQRAINRLMYGERDEPYIVLSRLGQRLEATLAHDAVLPTIVQTVKDTLKLPYAAIALVEGDGFVIAAAAGTPAIDQLGLPLVYQGETIGQLLVGPRSAGEDFSHADRRLLDDLARQAGVAVHAVQLTADLQRLTVDLQRSREELVLAREEERRRLRRDLHDDLAPTLAGLAFTARATQNRLASDPAAAAALLTELHDGIRTAVGEIRRLAYDLRPPALDEFGLIAAVRERAAQYSGQAGNGAGAGLSISILAPERLPPLPAAVEVAAYRIFQEAVMNVIRHAQARTCRIRIALAHGFELEVTDDGIGVPDDYQPGVGLRSMRERAAELGGTCVIERNHPTGTRVAVRLPVRKEEQHGATAAVDR